MGFCCAKSHRNLLKETGMHECALSFFWNLESDFMILLKSLLLSVTSA